MRETDEPVPRRGPSPLSPRIASTLATIIDRYGVAALFKRDQIELLLRQESPDAMKEIAFVLTALAEDVPQRLLSAHDDVALRSLLPQVVDRLARHSEFDPQSAAWAVRTWATALALPVDGLVVRSPAPAGTPSVASSMASVVTPLAGGRPPVPPKNPEVVTASPAPAVMPPSAQVLAPRPPIDERPSAPPIAAQIATVAPSTTAPAAGTKPTIEPGLVAIPTPPPAQPVPEIASTVAPALPPAPPDPRVAPRRSFAIPFLAIAALVLVAAAVNYAWQQRRPSTAPAAVATNTSAVALPSSSLTTPVAPPIEAAPPLDKSPDTTAVAPRSATPPLTRQSTPTPSESIVATAGPAAPSSVAPVAAPPPTAAVPAIVGPTVARVELPRLVKGKPFEMTVVPASRTDRAAAVEYLIARGTGTRSGAPTTTSLAAVARTSAGAWVVPVAAIETAGRASMAITLVDAAGVHGPSRQVDLYVAPDIVAAPTVATSAPPPCTRSTCGSIVSVRPIDSTGTMEMIVRMDDREIHTVRQAARWNVGSRVQKNGDRYSLLR